MTRRPGGRAWGGHRAGGRGLGDEGAFREAPAGGEASRAVLRRGCSAQQPVEWEWWGCCDRKC
ncbi:hypothetical protein GCM10010505_42950 [Kitasatospora aburaviensis]